MSKYDTISSFILGSNGKFQQKTGKFSLGASPDFNYNASNAVIAVGSAYTQGNQVRSLFDINDSPARRYNYTEKDELNVKSQFGDTFLMYPNLSDFPYLYNPVDTEPSTLPVYRYSGKGLGSINFRTNGTQSNGNVFSGSPKNMEFYTGYSIVWHTNVGDIPPQPSPKNINGICYPYSGLLYSGNLVQLTFEQESIYNKVKIVPYQAGRGIPQYDPTKEYFGGNQFGAPKWPGTDLTIEPCLSWGSNPGNNDICVGAVLDTEAPDTRSRIYNTPVTEGYTKEELQNSPFVKWYNHPAPFTAPSADISFTRTPKVFSPGPNLSDTYYAPWPKFYAYQPNEETPVIMSGVTTLNIGAAYNIGMQAYYEPDVADGDNPINNPDYISIPIVPLFQGEKVKVGSDLYANAMGHVITHDRKGFDPYPLGSFINVCGLWGGVFECRDSRMSNPWYDWYDPTFGATGWTGTPAFLLSGIPDKGVAIIDTRNSVDLPFMVQSNQGSSIVHAVTIVNPLDENGSGRMKLLGPPEYSGETNLKFQSATKQPAFGGRALTIGNTLQEIEGTGRWTYTGAIDLPQTTFVNGWGLSTSSATYATRCINGVGNGMTINANATDDGGPATTYSINTLGTGYVSGDIVQLVTLFPYQDNYYKNYICSTCFMYNGTDLDPYLAGTNYKSDSGLLSFNLTKNNMVLYVIGSSEPLTSNGIILISDVIIAYNPIPSKYPPGTKILIDTSSYSDWSEAVVVSETNNGTSVSLRFASYNSSGATQFYLKGGATMYGDGSPLIFNTRIQNETDPTVTIIADADGHVQDVKITDMGTGNNHGDLILVQQPGSDNNFIFQLNAQSEDYILERISGGARYPWFELATNYIHNSPELYNNLSVKNPGGTYTNNSVTLNFSSIDNGTIKTIKTNVLNATFNGTFGNVNTLEMKLPWDYSDGGNTSIVYNNNATFEQVCYFVITNPGTGYTVNGNYIISSGSGNGMLINILEVSDDTGQITKVSLQDIGTGYMPEDIVDVVGGDNNAQLTLEFYPTTVLGTKLLFAEFGSGYSIGGPYNVSTDGIGTGMTVNVLEVSSDGATNKIEIVSQGTDYSNNDIQTILSGDNNSNFNVISEMKIYNTLTNAGSNYTSETNVDTFNISLNSLYPLCDTTTGQCLVSDINGEERPEWDVSRYTVGDVLEFIDGVNASATAEILTVDPAVPVVTFSQLTNGAGYTVSSANTYVQSNNTSKSKTTVDITADDDGFITNVTINTLGDDVKLGDYLIIQQSGSDNNCVVKLSVEKDVPPASQPFVNFRDATHTEWNEYKEIMTGSRNLLSEQIIVDLKPSYPNYMNESWSFYGDGGIKNDPNVELELCAIL